MHSVYRYTVKFKQQREAKFKINSVSVEGGIQGVPIFAAT